jgi:GH15 family glucan-1,4-alpha-glucosidase
MANRIEDYALIGDCQTAALIARDGSLDWLCWPRFDSDACFAALLGQRDNGRWLLAPAGADARKSRRYRGDSLILETDIETADGAATLIEFMPSRGDSSHVVRLIKGKRGTVALRTELIIRFGYGLDVPWVTRTEDGSLSAICGPDMLLLRTTVPLRARGLTTVGDFTVGAGDVVAFVLSYGPSHLAPPAAIDPARALTDTEEFWRVWSGQYHGRGEWAEPVMRSLITLKGLTSSATGGIVAAATTSLPESLGGIRNWDYRYCWLRDATFVLLALMNSGYYEEAQAWRGWLLRALAGQPGQLQVLYGLSGERRLREWEADWLAGYEGSRPVRIGNAASNQLQIDIYGEVMDALYHGRKGKLSADAAGWALQRALLAHLETIWEEPDEGIWEVRGGRRHFTYSKVMAWVALDRALRSAEEFGLEGPLGHWRTLRDRIQHDVCTHAFDPALGSFVRSYGSNELDASLLLVPLVGFLPAEDPRVRGTLAAIEQRLIVDGLVRRYDLNVTRDGLSGGEGAFLACSFWYADNLVMAGRRKEAHRLFRRLLSLRNDVGLLAEEYDPRARRQLGNFPQALSHIALINTADNLVQSRKPAEQRSGRRAAS